MQFPLYWFSVPAILKGWFDRVLTQGYAFSLENLYDKGVFKVSLSHSDEGCQPDHNGEEEMMMMIVRGLGLLAGQEGHVVLQYGGDPDHVPA